MRSRAKAPVWIPEDAPPIFPDPREFGAHGLLAGGGDLSSARLLAAYRTGIFPWYDEPPILWWSPDPRAVISPKSLHLSRSLKRTLRTTRFTVTSNQALSGVMEGCADRPEGTWLTPEMQDAYLKLADLGCAASYEVWEGATLVGGLYGVLIGGLFAAESKFHRRTDASKIALVCAVADLFHRGVRLFDVQFRTDHLETLGVHELSRDDYLERLKSVVSLRLSAPCPEPNLLPSVRRQLRLS